MVNIQNTAGGKTTTEKDLHALLESMSLKEKLGELWQPMNRAFDENGVLTGNEVKLDKKCREVAPVRLYA